MSNIDEIFKALSDETRREIVKLLKERDMSAGEISEYFSISKPSISFHLKILKNAELIESRKLGQNVIYSLQMSVFQDTINMFFNFISKGEKNEK